MEYEIIDFHTHPYKDENDCICIHSSAIKRSPDEFLKDAKDAGVSKFCGSVISFDKKDENKSWWDIIKKLNDDALYLKDYYNGAYIPGCTIHPEFVEESKGEIDRFKANGINLIGELVWYIQGYNTYCSENMKEILDYASKKDMVLSVHLTNNDDMDLLCENHPDLKIVCAHPCEGELFERHLLRAKKNKNYYLDLSGGGMYRYGMTRRLIDEIGVDKILFGSDYPICTLQMYVDGIKNDRLLTEEEKIAILAGNAKKLLNLQ